MEQRPLLNLIRDSEEVYPLGNFQRGLRSHKAPLKARSFRPYLAVALSPVLMTEDQCAVGWAERMNIPS